MFLIFDTETTGFPLQYNAPLSDTQNWPRVVQLAWQIHDLQGKLVSVKNYIIKPEGFTIPYNAEKVHGISTERALKQGMPLQVVIEEFLKDLETVSFTVGHNIEFDNNVLGCELFRLGIDYKILTDKKSIDTKEEGTDFCALPGGKGGKFKWPTLTELYTKLFGEAFGEAHNASADVEATARCFLELIRIEVITAKKLGFDADFTKSFKQANPASIQLIGLNIQPYQPIDSSTSAELGSDEKKIKKTAAKETQTEVELNFAHLHNHSQYSVLQSTTEIKALVARAVKEKMPAVGLSDLGNMYAAFQFMKEVSTHNKSVAKKIDEGDTEAQKLIPLLGCEFNVCTNHLDNTTKDLGRMVPIFAKNKRGYHNLAKLVSISWRDGFYYVPRIDKTLLEQYKEDLIVFSGGLNGEVPWLILNVGEERAEEAFLWWKDTFGEDFYIELNNHGLDEEKHANEVMVRFCKKHNVKYFAANNTYYLDQENAEAHDILLCVKDGERKSTPIGRGKDFRFGFPNNEFYFKSKTDMVKLFKEYPEAISTIQEIYTKVEPFDLASDVLLPKFAIPAAFEDPEDKKDGGIRGENAYLRHLTFEGAKKRYGTITPEIEERLNFELKTIENTGYPGYFLIVQDFTSKAREMDVAVGPGRGSAAGSAVAYCVGITNVDPIKYDLLFERFLNPDRVSLPDIDIDFDDEGRGRIIDWVVKKYGQSQVAQIITYGTMAAKSAVRDTARVLDLPLPESDKLAKLIPDKLGLKLRKLFNATDEELKSDLTQEDFAKALLIREIHGKDSLEGRVLRQAEVLEGSLRNTGIHACGVIIAPQDLTSLVPIATSNKEKEGGLLVTQFDNSVVESAGLLKMDFLGLKTLTIIKDAIKIIKERHGIEIDPDTIPLDDEKTYELYQRGSTNGTFQFESPGMQKHLRALKPTTFADLIAMNALYRPGPMEYIPSFVRRKHGEEPIIYDLDETKEYLEETYGITVYQEQVMLLSQKLAGFTKGEADMLRKAMGKKIAALLATLKPKFIEQAAARGLNREKLEKIWMDWEEFAKYAFNKSHSTCYSVVAFQTGYLKAHYPAEYMAAVLTHNKNDIKKVTFFMEECKRMGIKVLGPDVNESNLKFTVNDKGEIRFGLGAIKGVGEHAVESIVAERKENGKYNDIYDFMKRIDARFVNKKCLESLVLAGGFDCFNEVKRHQYFAEAGRGTFLELLAKFGQDVKQRSNSGPTLFGDTIEVEIENPKPPMVEPWHHLTELSKEKEVVGIYLSGHPLDQFKVQMNHYCKGSLKYLENYPLERLNGKTLRFGGMITEFSEAMTKKGKLFGRFTLEDYSGNYKFFAFGDQYLNLKKHLFTNNFVLLQARVQPRKTYGEPNPDAPREYSVEILSIEPLADAIEKFSKALDIILPLDKLDRTVVEDLETLLKKHPGSTPVKIHIRHRLINNNKKRIVSLPMRSTNSRVSLSDELVDSIQHELKIPFSIKVN
ncbi:MAG: DNA polymerase III subunit alpha [Luteibaculaceae bacterium]